MSLHFRPRAAARTIGAMKKSFQIIAVLFSLAATSAIVLHAGHLDADHLNKNPTHQCGLCKTTEQIDVPAGASCEPVFVSLSLNLVFNSLLLSNNLLSNQDSRAPPLA